MAKIKLTPVSRLLKRSKTPLPMVGYPTAHEWPRYWQLNYDAIIAEGNEWRRRKAAEVQREHGPFVEDWAA